MIHIESYTIGPATLILPMIVNTCTVGRSSRHGNFLVPNANEATNTSLAPLEAQSAGLVSFTIVLL